VGSLTVAGLMGNAYERNQHERLSEKLGFGRDWVAAVNRLQPDASGPMSEDERAIQRLAIAVVERRGHGVETELDAVIDRIGHAQAMAALFLIGRYVMHAYVVNALNLAPPVPSIFAGETP
jgi:alkylhydroperoxidase family enzyme